MGSYRIATLREGDDIYKVLIPLSTAEEIKGDEGKMLSKDKIMKILKTALPFTGRGIKTATNLWIQRGGAISVLSPMYGGIPYGS